LKVLTDCKTINSDCMVSNSVQVSPAGPGQGADAPRRPCGGPAEAAR
jgi:hypothetical protein